MVLAAGCCQVSECACACSHDTLIVSAGMRIIAYRIAPPLGLPQQLGMHMLNYTSTQRVVTSLQLGASTKTIAAGDNLEGIWVYSFSEREGFKASVGAAHSLAWVRVGLQEALQGPVQPIHALYKAHSSGCGDTGLCRAACHSLFVARHCTLWSSVHDVLMP